MPFLYIVDFFCKGGGVKDGSSSGYGVIGLIRKIIKGQVVSYNLASRSVVCNIFNSA